MMLSGCPIWEIVVTKVFCPWAGSIEITIEARITATKPIFFKLKILVNFYTTLYQTFYFPHTTDDKA